jgi:Xaa-Pro aminopeptidase
VSTAGGAAAGPQLPPGIAPAEFAGRVERAREAADAAGFDALLAFSSSWRPGNAFWLTGVTPTNGHVLAVAGPQGLDLLVDQPWDLGSSQAQAWLPADRVHAAADLAAGAAPLLAGARRVGVAGWEILPAPVHVALREALGPGVEIGPAGPVLDRLRMRKSPAEVALLREACRITDEGARAFAEGCAEGGMTERELAVEIETALKRAGSGRLAFPLILGAGADRTASVVPFPGDRRLERGDLVLLDVGGTYGGYCADLSRTACVGLAPTDEQRHLLETVLEIYHAMEEALAPGIRADELHALAVGRARAAGYEMPFLVGHNTGCENHEDPVLDGTSDLVLEPGMLETLEPGIYVPGVGGCRIEKTVLVTETGCEPLSAAPLRLW